MFYDVFYNFGNLSVFLLLERLFSPGARLWPPCGLRRLCGHRARECPSQHLCVHGEMVVFPIMILILQEKMGSKLDSIT